MRCLSLYLALVHIMEKQVSTAWIPAFVYTTNQATVSSGVDTAGVSVVSGRVASARFLPLRL